MKKELTGTSVSRAYVCVGAEKVKKTQLSKKSISTGYSCSDCCASLFLYRLARVSLVTLLSIPAGLISSFIRTHGVIHPHDQHIRQVMIRWYVLTSSTYSLTHPHDLLF